MNQPPEQEPKPPPLLQQLQVAARECGHSPSTIDLLVPWARAFILFHDKTHPNKMGYDQVAHFLEHVVQTEVDPLPALAQARTALALLYTAVLGIDLGEMPEPQPPKLLDQLRQVLRLRHYSPKTEESYVNWTKRYLYFHRLRHPRTMGAIEVEQFLTDLATERTVSASTQNQAINALVFFYQQVLRLPLGRIDAVLARRGKRRGAGRGSGFPDSHSFPRRRLHPLSPPRLDPSWQDAAAPHKLKGRTTNPHSRRI